MLSLMAVMTHRTYILCPCDFAPAHQTTLKEITFKCMWESFDA